MELGLKRNQVLIEDYNPQWKLEFLKEKELLSKLLIGYDVVIEHVGSTAIKECAAKPIIDIAIGVPNLQYGKDLLPLLISNGWNYEEKDNNIRLFLTKGKDNIYTHYLHIEDIHSRIWQNHILFRDYLNQHPEKVKEYSDLKKKYAHLYKDNRKEYTKTKDPFIKEIINNAFIEYNTTPINDDYKF